MKRTQLKDALRNIWNQKVSYLSIIVIALLGVTVFLGIDYSSAAMRINGSVFYNEANFRDIEVFSTLLLTEEDLAAFLADEDVTDAEPVWQTNAKAAFGGQKQDAAVISLTERVNLPTVVEGRLPGTAEECAVELSLAKELGLSVGDRLALTASSGEAAQYLLSDSYEITGFVIHPDHANTTTLETHYVMVTGDAFDKASLDGCFMKAEIVIDREPDANRFSENYKAAVSAVVARLDALSETRTSLRDAEVRQQYQAEIDDGQAQLDSGAAELRDARAELDDGWAQLADGDRELADGRKTLNEAETELADAWQQLQDAQAELADAREQLDGARSRLDSGAAELRAAEAQLADAKAQLISGWNELEDAKELIRNAIRTGVEDVLGSEAAADIPWAGRQPVDLSGSSSASDIWITEDMKYDPNISMNENLLNMLTASGISAEELIRAYASLTGGTEE